MKKIISVVLVLIILGNIAVAAHTRDDVRAIYRAISGWTEASPYAQSPQVTAPYTSGELNAKSVSDTLNYLNFVRWLAYLDAPVAESRIYNYQCQHGAVLLAALDYVDHNAPRTSDMDDNFYNSAHIGTSSGNIAKFNWMRSSILREGVEYFVRDDGESNLPVLGHRRWVLNPRMAYTGFGLANSESGMSYVVMYAHDFGYTDAEWTEICWPSAGAFPADLMHSDLAWSIILNTQNYDLSAALPTITLTEKVSGLSFEFQPGTGEGDGFSTISFENYGAGPCLIFRPDFSDTDFTDYQQNQRWLVRVDNLYTIEGTPAPLEYEVDMMALYAQDVSNIEISHPEAELAPGESLQLAADVIPAYADDLTIEWHSSDALVAAVNEAGFVVAAAEGDCEIIARSANGREDKCHLTVKNK